MRFKRAPRPQPGDKKTIRRFLFFPLTLRCETRWLEMADIIYQYQGFAHPFGSTYWKWSPVAWSDE